MPVVVETFDRLEDAANALRSARNARMFGGGTILMRAVNEGDTSFDTLIRTTDAKLREIRSESDSIVIGAGVTMSDIRNSPELAFLEPAARTVGGPAIRNAATVGGNLFARAPYGEFAVALLALGARVNLAGSGGGQASMDDFLRDRDRNQAQVVASVSVPRVRDAGDFRFHKVTRVKPKGIAVMSIAAYLPRPTGRIEGARVAFGNMGPAPLRSTGAEGALEGGTLDAATVDRAAAAVLNGLDPQDDAIASEWYRREVAPVHFKRALLGQ